jgi:uncharacterized protein
MSLKQQIAQEFVTAFKAKDMQKKDVLSMIQSEIKNKEIELGTRDKGLTDEEVAAVISRAIKQRKDSVQQFTDGGRPELAEKEQAEIEVLQKYLPEQIGDEEIEKEIAAVIAQTGAQGKADLGKVMGAAMGRLKGKADGTKVREIAQKLLTDDEK